ncbi:MAG: AmmeMemoRadiSam system protein A [Myxococcaceae bacterium]|nr:AmmeMemoRadiSam system protein A [Myxococcaceae bacterium]
MNGDVLLSIARGSIAEAFGGPKPVAPAGEPWLDEQGAAFVTLTLDHALRGCVGSAQARRPLYDDVVENAKAAAFGDPRFTPLTADELARTRLEVSVLSPLEKLDVENEAQLLAVLRPGVDGLQLSWGAHRALFIPEMWHQVPDPREFVRLLKRKAGMPPHEWLPGTRVHRFTAQRFAEPEARS